MKVKIFVTCCILLVMILISCDSKPMPPNDGFQAAQFPQDIGVLWKYEVVDSLTRHVDTVLISIVKDTILKDMTEVVMWKSNINGDYETFFLYPIENNLIFFHSSIHSDHFQFPFKEGDSWQHPFNIRDTCFVIEKKEISVPYGRFSNGYYLHRDYDHDFEGGNKLSEFVLVPNIGMVYKYERHQYSDGQTLYTSVNRVWRLIEYYPTTFTIEQFPMSENNEWTYQRTDAYSSTIDTVRVTIVDDNYEYQESNATLWEYDYEFFVDTAIVYYDEDFIIVEKDSLTIWHDNSYLFPLAVGQYWGPNPIYPINGFYTKEVVTVPAGTFESFVYSYKLFIPNDNRSIQEWIVPGVGVVKRRIFIIGYKFTDETYELIDYRIR